MKKIKKISAFILTLLMVTVSVFSGNTVDVMAASGSLKLNTTNASMYTGQAGTLHATKKNIRGTIRWSSSNPGVAIVNSNGKVTARKAGTTYITAKCGNYKARCKVTVKKTNARIGFYCGGLYNTRRIVIQKISGNKVQFQLCYSGKYMAVSKTYVGKIVNDRVTFKVTDDWKCTTTGTIIFKKNCLVYKATGNSFLSTNGTSYTCKWINSNPKVTQIY